MPERRPLWTVVGLLALAALLLWVSSLMTWSWTQHSDPLTGVVTTKLNGSEREAALVPLALLALALIAAVVATGGLVRRIAGGVVFLVGVGTVWLLSTVSARSSPSTRAPTRSPRSRWVTASRCWPGWR